MRQKLEVPKQISFSKKDAEKIQRIADTLNVSFPEIVRECVARELDKLIDREKRRQRTSEKQN